MDGIDMIHCGRADLAAAMGSSGGTNDPEALRAENAVNRATLAAGKLVGYHAPPGSHGEKSRGWLANGAQCVTIGGDTQILFSSASSRLSTLSGLTEEG